MLFSKQFILSDCAKEDSFIAQIAVRNNFRDESKENFTILETRGILNGYDVLCTF